MHGMRKRLWRWMRRKAARIFRLYEYQEHRRYENVEIHGNLIVDPDAQATIMWCRFHPAEPSDAQA